MTTSFFVPKNIYAATNITSINGFEKLAEVSCSTACTELQSPTFAVRTHLLVNIFTSNGFATSIDMRFNGDSTSSAYGYHYANIATTGIAGATGTSTFMRLAPSNGNEQRSVSLNIRNDPTLVKTYTGTGSNIPVGQNPTSSILSGRWNNTTNSITSIRVYTTTGANMDAGSKMVIYGTNGDTKTTTIQEEDGLSHIRLQEEGSDVIINPDVINFVGGCITLTNPPSTITGLLTSTCGTGGGSGGFGLLSGGISTAQASEIEATLNEDGDVMSLGLTDEGWQLVNAIVIVLVFIGALILFVLAFTIGRSYVKRQ
jgi:hypothetical protein